MSASEIPVTELLSFTASPTLLEEASKGDYSRLYAIWELIGPKPGLQSQAFGRLIGKDEFLAFIDWDDIKYHDDLIKDEAFFTVFITKHIGPLIDVGAKEPMRKVHIPFKPWPPANGLKGPIVNLVVGLLHSNENEDALNKLVGSKLLPALEATKGSTGTSTGYTVVNDEETGSKAFVAISGWASVEDDIGGFRKTDEYISFAKELDSLVEIKKDVHVELQHWKRA